MHQKPKLSDSDLRALGITRLPCPIPYREAGGPANAYAVEEKDGGILLFDAGLGSPEAEAAIAQGLARAGYSFADVRRIIVSHGHVDHYGGARTAIEKSGRDVPVFAHPLDIPKIIEGGQVWSDRLPHYANYLARLGVPFEIMAVAAQEAGRGLALARQLERVQPLALDEPLRLKHVVLELWHMPGHTPGLVCLYEPSHQLFFSNDHLLEKVSPNPIIELGPDGEEGVFLPLVRYLESLARVRALDIELVLPGHAEPFGNHRALIDALVAFYDRRQAKIRRLLATRPLTPYELVQRLFPSAKPRQLILTVSEAVANLEVMQERGQVVRAVDGDHYRFALAA